jgi:hypothetical protein
MIVEWHYNPAFLLFAWWFGLMPVLILCVESLRRRWFDPIGGSDGGE